MEPLLSSKQICEYLKISYSGFIKLAYWTDGFPTKKIGYTWRCEPEALREWLASQQLDNIPEIPFLKRDDEARRTTAMERLIDSKEICEYLGISPNSIYRLAEKDSTFPVFKIGSRWKAEPEALREWVRQQRSDPDGYYNTTIEIPKRGRQLTDPSKQISPTYKNSRYKGRK